MTVGSPARTVPARRWTAQGVSASARALPEEVPVALVHNASTTAVMMATPADLEDFALGFTLTEGIAGPSDVREVEIVPTEEGVEARIWLTHQATAAMNARRRRLAGPTGCGLCGLDSLKAANRALPRLADTLRLIPEEVQLAVASLTQAQPLGRATRAVHAAGYWTPRDGLLLAREDVGRHNALDKLVGALLRQSGVSPEGIIVLTSRVSIELVQKAVVFGAEVLAAVSAPTVYAVEQAEASGLTLVAVARADGFEIFTHPERIKGCDDIGRPGGSAESGG